MPEAQTPPPATREVQPDQPDLATLAGDLGLRDADGIRRHLAQMIEAGGRVRVDVHSVTAVDVSIVQVLLAAAHSSAERDCVLELAGFDESPLPVFMAAIGLIPPGVAGIDVHDILTMANMSEEEA